MPFDIHLKPFLGSYCLLCHQKEKDSEEDIIIACPSESLNRVAEASLLSFFSRSLGSYLLVNLSMSKITVGSS